MFMVPLVQVQLNRFLVRSSKNYKLQCPNLNHGKTTSSFLPDFPEFDTTMPPTVLECAASSC